VVTIDDIIWLDAIVEKISGNGRYLSVFFIKKLGNKALIVTARDMNRRERKRYEKK